MLQSIRERTQGWIAGVIISIIIVTFALWGIHSYFVGGGASEVVAEVNGVEITRPQLASAYERLRRQYQAENANTPAPNLIETKALQNQALDLMIETEVLRQAAMKEGFRISDPQLDAFLQNMPPFQINGQFSFERFQQILANYGISAGEFLELMRTTLLINQPKLGIVYSAFALPQEINYSTALVNQERDIDYTVIPVNRFLTADLKVTPAEIKRYYDEHKQAFMTPEQVSLEYIVLNSDILPQTSASENALRQYYKDNISAYTQPTQWKLVSFEIATPANSREPNLLQVQQKGDAVKQQLLAGKDPKTIAGVTLGALKGESWLSLSQIPEEYQKTVLAELTQAGQVTDPIRTANGFTIIKVIDMKQPETQSFEKVKDKVIASYSKQQAEEKFLQLRDQLADVTYEHPESLEFAAKTLNLPIKQTALFTKDKGTNDISQNKKVRNIAFSNDVMNLKNNSDVIQIDPHQAVVIRVKEHLPANVMTLKNVSKYIEDRIKINMAEEKAGNYTKELVKQLKAVAHPQVANTVQLNWNHAGFIGRYSNKVESAILEEAFHLPNPNEVNQKIVYGNVKLSNGFAIVALKAVKPGTIDPKQFTVFAEQAANSDAAIEYGLYKQSQMKKAKIKVE